jgi:hypothetical protein
LAWETPVNIDRERRRTAGAKRHVGEICADEIALFQTRDNAMMWKAGL